MPEPSLSFPPFRLDAANACLWRESQALSLTPKSFAVLQHLARNPDRLITKSELLDAVWPRGFVSDAVLKVSVREIRKVLGDDPQAPRFIATVHRRGYRFVAPIGESQPAPRRLAAAGTRHSAATLVGREAELEQMRGWLERASHGKRQIAFVAGEPGIGKTTLVDAFLDQAAADERLWIGVGQCVEHYGTGEAYLPVLEALGRLCRGAGGERIVGMLDRFAPTWLAQLPSLLSPAGRERLQQAILSGTRERMLREMAEALEAITAETPLVMVLEDLHWSDYATLDLVNMLARRRGPARLLLIGTYRPVDVIVSQHPLRAAKQELQLHAQCLELTLELLSEAEVSQYLEARFPAARHAARLNELARIVHRRTEGNPLFMVNAVDYIVAAGTADAGQDELTAGIRQAQAGVPENIRQMIEKQIAQLPATEQRLLEAASVAGPEFSAYTLARVLEEDGMRVEECCEELAGREQFLRAAGIRELPDGDVTARYRFIHALYQDALYQRVGEMRRIRLHRRIGEVEEIVCGERASEIATELAMHFERGRDYPRAVNYLRQAAEIAARRFAYQEAVALAGRGLELIRHLPESPARTGQELGLQIALGMPLIATRGYAAPEVGAAYTRARELCQPLGDPPELFPALFGLLVFYQLRAELDTALELGEQLLRVANKAENSALLARAHWTLQVTLMHRGEFDRGMRHFEKFVAHYDQRQHRADVFRYALNPGVAAYAFAACTSWYLGRPDKALAYLSEALVMAQALSEPHGLAYAHFLAAVVHQFRREEGLTQEHAEAALAVASEHGLPLFAAFAMVLRGWALAGQGQAEEGVQQMHQGLAAQEMTGALLVRPHLLALLAEGLGNAGQAAAGLAALDQTLAMTERTGERDYEAEIYRLKGELLLKQTVENPESSMAAGETADLSRLEPAGLDEAKTCFSTAITIARRQHARSWELRAVMSLSRLYQQRGKRAQARRMLQEIYASFAEGFDTKDLKDAGKLLDALGP